MSVLSENPGQRYECGVTNVTLLGHPSRTVATSVVFQNEDHLHQLIALALVRRAGPLSGKEIAFLREKYFKLSQSDFAKQFAISLSILRAVEGSAQNDFGIYRDGVLRKMVYKDLRKTPPVYSVLQGLYNAPRSEDPILIEAEACEQNYWKLAA